MKNIETQIELLNKNIDRLEIMIEQMDQTLYEIQIESNRTNNKIHAIYQTMIMEKTPEHLKKVQREVFALESIVASRKEMISLEVDISESYEDLYDSLVKLKHYREMGCIVSEGVL